MRIAASRNSGSASLSRKPLAPCRIARAAASSRSNVVSITTRGGSCVAQQLGGRREAVHHRHPDVHQHDVGSAPRGRRRALRARRMPRPRPRGRAASRSACGCRRGTAPDRRRGRRGWCRSRERLRSAAWPTPRTRRPRRRRRACRRRGCARSPMPISPWPGRPRVDAAPEAVAHLELDVVGDARREPHRDRAAVAVAKRVRERLLQDAVHGELHGRGRLARRRRVDVDPQLDAGGPHLGVELLEVGQGGLRTLALAVAQLRQQQPHVGERRPGGRRDRLERVGRGGGVRPRRRTARRRPGRSRRRASGRRRRACRGRSAPAPARRPPRPPRAPAPRGWHRARSAVRTRAPTVHDSSSAKPLRRGSRRRAAASATRGRRRRRSDPANRYAVMTKRPASADAKPAQYTRADPYAAVT